MDLLSFAIGMAAGLGLAAIVMWGRRSRGSVLDRPPQAARPLPQLDPALDRDIDDLISRGRKIEAIKLIRTSTGCGLKEAKDHFEQLMRERG